MTLLISASLLVLFTCAAGQLAKGADKLPDAPPFYADEPACKVKSVKPYPAAFETRVASPSSNAVLVTQLDSKGVYQVYVASDGNDDFGCITCASRLGAPDLSRNKPMVSWHPSGLWLVVGVEETTHDLAWMPISVQRGLLQSGMWLNIWITTPTGDRWYQITDFKPASGPSNGYVGAAFSPDGSKVVWAEIVDGNVFANAFGVWKLYSANFHVGPDGVPSFLDKKDITPAGAQWVEPGNFSADGKQILLSSDIGITNAQGQDQWALTLSTGQLSNLTRTPAIWDEHGLYSPDSRKISFMSSYPYRSNPYNSQVPFLRTEFMLMDADGGHLQQLTHFNVPGYSEFQPSGAVAATAMFLADGSKLFATVMAPNFTKSNWTITFEGPCGARPSK